MKKDRCRDLPDSDRGDFKCRRAVDSSRSKTLSGQCLTASEYPISQWRHDKRDGVSNHQRLDCLLYYGNSPVTDEFPSQRASNTEMLPFDDLAMYILLYIAGVIPGMCVAHTLAVGEEYIVLLRPHQSPVNDNVTYHIGMVIAATQENIESFTSACELEIQPPEGAGRCICHMYCIDYRIDPWYLLISVSTIMTIDPTAWITKKFPCKNSRYLTKLFKPGTWLAGNTAASRSEAMVNMVNKNRIQHGMYLVIQYPGW